MKIEKIALVFFPINDVGGIITWNKQIQLGFKKLGVETMYFYATPTLRFNVDNDNDILKERYTQLAGYHLSYHKNKLKETLEILNSFDAVIFTKSSPHPTKDNLKHESINYWSHLYTEVKVPKVVVFHDELWEKTNSWSEEVAEHVDICIAAQKRFIHSVNRYPSKGIKYYDFFPMDFDSIDKLDLNAKQNFGMVATQWIKWKNHHKLLPLMPKISTPILLFGAGMEWHYLKKTQEYKEAIGVDLKMNGCELAGVDQNDIWEFLGNPKIIVHNGKSPHPMVGTVKYPLLQEFYSKALFSLDLSSRGYTNYTHFEPLAYRTVSMMHNQVIVDDDNIIPSDCCIGYDWETLVERIEMLNKSQQGFYSHPALNRIRNNGQKFIRQAECKFVAQRIIDNLQKL